MIDYATILTRKYKGEWTLNGDDYQGLTWLSDSKKPTKQELDSLWDTVKQEIEAEAQAKINAKATAEAKLTALGLTADEIKTLGLQNNLYS